MEPREHVVIDDFVVIFKQNLVAVAGVKDDRRLVTGKHQIVGDGKRAPAVKADRVFRAGNNHNRQIFGDERCPLAPTAFHGERKQIAVAAQLQREAAKRVA